MASGKAQGEGNVQKKAAMFQGYIDDKKKREQNNKNANANPVPPRARPPKTPMAQQKTSNNFDKAKCWSGDFKNYDADSVSNVLVLLIGISKYYHHQWCDLNGVPIDISNYENLWQKDYNYDIFPEKGTKWYKKETWTAQEIMKFLRIARKKLFDEEEEALQYAAMIMVYCGHGLDGVIIASNGDKVPINDIHSKFSGAWVKEATKIPRVFIFDCCRKDEKKAVFGRGGRVHIADMTCSLFGNSPGLQVDENKKGGFFSQCVIECMRKNKDNPTFTITDLSIALIDKVQDKSAYGQTCWKEGDGRIDKKVFNVNGTKKKSQSEMKNDDDEDVNVGSGRVPLKIHSFNGCYNDYTHPINLLADGRNDCYSSKHGATSGDWIIFQVADNKNYAPKWLKIKNMKWKNGLRDVRLLFHYSDNSSKGFSKYFKSKWTNEQKIKNIYRKSADDQWFPLNVKPANNEKLKLIKLIIDNNHGDDDNNSFALFTLYAGNKVPLFAGTAPKKKKEKKENKYEALRKHYAQKSKQMNK